MEKIPTLFERDWEGHRKVIDQVALTDFDFSKAVATEKLDGMNLRITVRNHTIVRVEKRRNPSKTQKAQGIKDPWYVDAREEAKEDQYLFEAVAQTDFSAIPDGEWSGEALGPKIQGNPLQLNIHKLFFFSLEDWRQRVTFKDVPTSFKDSRNGFLNRKASLDKTVGLKALYGTIPMEACAKSR